MYSNIYERASTLKTNKPQCVYSEDEDQSDQILFSAHSVKLGTHGLQMHTAKLRLGLIFVWVLHTLAHMS